jgi:hypothetical protein
MRAKLVHISDRKVQTWKLENNKIIMVEASQSGAPDAEPGAEMEAYFNLKGVQPGWEITGG